MTIPVVDNEGKPRPVADLWDQTDERRFGVQIKEAEFAISKADFMRLIRGEMLTFGSMRRAITLRNGPFIIVDEDAPIRRLTAPTPSEFVPVEPTPSEVEAAISIKDPTLRDRIRVVLKSFVDGVYKLVGKHASPTHPGTGTDQQVHAGEVGGSLPGGEAGFDNERERASVLVPTGPQTSNPREGITRDQVQHYHNRRNATEAASRLKYRDGSTAKELIDQTFADGFSEIKRERFGYVLKNPETEVTRKFKYKEERDYIDTLLSHGNFSLNYEIVERGGEGSGHFEHEGRPGEIGGSLPSGEAERVNLTKSNINKFIKWSSSRYTPYKKHEVVLWAYEILNDNHWEPAWKPEEGADLVEEFRTRVGSDNVEIRPFEGDDKRVEVKIKKMVVESGTYTEPSFGGTSYGAYLINGEEGYIATGRGDDPWNFQEEERRYFVPKLSERVIWEGEPKLTHRRDEIESKSNEVVEVRGLMRRISITSRSHSRSKCMECDNKPVVATHWANGHGMAWFCFKHFKSWVKEDERDIVGVWVLKEGECPDDIRKNPSGTEKIRKLGESISIDKVFSRIDALIKRGGEGSGHFKHEGRPGKIGGSQPGKRQVGLTSARPGKPSSKVFVQMRDFQSKLQEIGGVSDVSVKPGLGGWEGGREPTWVISFRGNGNANSLIAQTALDNNQDGVLLIDPCDPPPDCAPVIDFHFADSVTPSERDAVESMLVAQGVGGWTWYRREGEFSSLRAVYVPDWEERSAGEYFESFERLRFMFDKAKMPHLYESLQASVSVMNKEGENSYGDFIGRGTD